MRGVGVGQVVTVGARGSFHLWRREQGLLTPEGVNDVGGLRGRRVARRGVGTGTRVLLDRLLAEAGIESVAGPEADSHLEVAMAIASGQADAGTWEDFDIVLSADALAAAEPMIAALRDPAVQSWVHALSGYDLCDAGTVRLLE